MTSIQGLSCGRGLVVRCDRELSMESVSAIEALLLARRGRSRFLVLDLSRAAYADSAGLRWLACVRENLERQGMQLRVIVGPRGTLRRALALSGFDRFLPLF